MARWAVRWLLLIAFFSIVTYAGTNMVAARNDFAGASYAMMPIGQLGSPACSQATRGLVAAADGAAANATGAQREAYDRAAAGVLAACGGA